VPLAVVFPAAPAARAVLADSPRLQACFTAVVEVDLRTLRLALPLADRAAAARAQTLLPTLLLAPTIAAAVAAGVTKTATETAALELSSFNTTLVYECRLVQV
jgi:hypothetical protein